MIPKRTVTLAAYARAIKNNEPPEVVADALALDVAARLKEQIEQGLAKSSIDDADAAELADLLRKGSRA